MQISILSRLFCFNSKMIYIFPSIYLLDAYNMDPRPYHFDYRRPRVSNPTYLSTQLYDRIQQSPPKNHSVNNPELKRINSTDLQSQTKSQLDNLSYRYNSKGTLASSEKLNTSMANYGRNLLGRANSGRQQEDVFERQERKFNIISYRPREVQPTLHKFPKLTLEDKLLQRDIPSHH